jgi:hypothetical protein
MNLICLPFLRKNLNDDGSLTGAVSRGKQQKNHQSFSNLAKQVFTFLIIILSISTTAFSQTSVKNLNAEAAYTNTINERAGKIVSTLNIADSAKAVRVKNIIADQYRNLNEIYKTRDAQLNAAKVKSGTANEATARANANTVQEETKIKLQKLHDIYLNKLSAELSATEVDQVKDGMTYGVVGITYKGYLAMIPTLTEEQKKQILSWLVEARELAMDAESSDKKHAWFGKYKGRINNYLSAAGYDLNKLSQDWHNRIKAEEARKKGQ